MIILKKFCTTPLNAYMALRQFLICRQPPIFVSRIQSMLPSTRIISTWVGWRNGLLREKTVNSGLLIQKLRAESVLTYFMCTLRYFLPYFLLLTSLFAVFQTVNNGLLVQKLWAESVLTYFMCVGIVL